MLAGSYSTLFPLLDNWTLWWRSSKPLGSSPVLFSPETYCSFSSRASSTSRTFPFITWCTFTSIYLDHICR